MDFSQLIELDHQVTLALNGSSSAFWDNVMFTFTNTLSWSLVIIVLIAVIIKNNRPKEALLVILTMVLLIVVADRICSGIVKPMVARWRPTQDPQLMYLVEVVRGYRGGRYGFFSGHACNTMCMATFLSLLFRYRAVTFTLFFWSITTTFTRIYLGVHHVGDVIVGFSVGLLLGTLFYILMERIHRRMGFSRLISSQFTNTGYLVSDMNLLLTTIFFNYTVVMIISLFLGLG